MEETMEVISGYVEHIIYRNTDNGYTVMQVVAEGEEITCTGLLRFIEEGEFVEAEGNFVSHSLYGEQFSVEKYEIIVPKDCHAIERYLGSGAVKGVGPALAGRIVKKFGEDTFRIIEQEPERLAEVKGISEKKAREIAIQAIERQDMRKAMIFLQQYGISNTLAVKIYDKYALNTYQIIAENPYALAEDVQGVGFKIADEIASKVGIHTDSDYRIRSGILHILLQASADGHVYLPEDELLFKTTELLGVEQTYIKNQLLNLMVDKKVIIKAVGESKVVYASSYYYLELNCARMLHDLNIVMGENQEEIAGRLKKLEKNSEIALEQLQYEAVASAAQNGVFVITGGPGTGKTTTINMIIKYFEEENLDILLAAPTGRAAKRMTEATGYEARTIHRMLEINGNAHSDGKGMIFERNEENPLEADVIIIDEMSMVDILLFSALLRAISIGTRLIMVGDINQLPSVGPGAVLKDIIESKAVHVVMLQKIFRQASESDIVVNAHKINRGEYLSMNNQSKDFFFLEREDVNVIMKVIITLVKEKLPKYVGATYNDIQVLTPMRKGMLGIERLNIVLQQYLNPPETAKKEKEYGEGIFREGDKVMQIKNNYQMEWEIRSKYGIPIDKGLGVFNGDMGIITDINSYAETLTVEYDEHKLVEYSFKQLEELELAYAITIHKAQGSEYSAVVMPLLSGPKMLLNRNLLYTGVTRAKKCVTLVGSERTIQMMIDNSDEQKRYTSFAERIKEICF